MFIDITSHCLLGKRGFSRNFACPVFSSDWDPFDSFSASPRLLDGAKRRRGRVEFSSFLVADIEMLVCYKNPWTGLYFCSIDLAAAGRMNCSFSWTEGVRYSIIRLEYDLQSTLGGLDSSVFVRRLGNVLAACRDWPQ